MAKARSNMLDALLSGSESDDDSSSSGSQGGKAGAQQEAGPAKRPRTTITVEDLQRAGYSGGPSVLLAKAPEEATCSWQWADGREAKQAGQAPDSFQDREHTRHAATDAVEEAALLARKAAEHAQRLRELKEQERLKEKEQSKPRTFNQKEKRKREVGQATGGGKNYVEEEKRLARQVGHYSGFD